MKKSKRIFAMIMALTMAVAMLAGLTVSAAVTGPGTITIYGPEGLILDGQTFKAYKIFEVSIFEVLDEDGDPEFEDDGVTPKLRYAYTLESDFNGFKDYPGGHDVPQTVSLADYLSDLKDNTVEMNDLATSLWNYIIASGGAIQPKNPPKDPDVDLDYDDYYEYDDAHNIFTIKNLPLGYYLVYGLGITTGDTGDDVSVVAACALTTTNKDAEVYLKADVPTIDKEIWNHHIDNDDDDDNCDGDDKKDSGDWMKWNDVSIGDSVYFRLTSAVPNMIGYSKYLFTVHDRMSKGLSFNENSVEIYLGGTREQYLAGDTDVKLLNDPDKTIIDYSVNTTQPQKPLADGCTFEIEFDPEVFITYDFGKDIYIYYSAILNEGAIIELNGNPNDAKLEYSRNPYFTDFKKDTNSTPWSKVKVYTGLFGFIKVDENGIATLPDAEFELYEEGSNKPIEFVKLTYAQAAMQIESADFFTNMKETLTENYGDKGFEPDKWFIYRVLSPAEKGAGVVGVTSLITPANGFVLVLGLGAGYAVYDEKSEEFGEFDEKGFYELIETVPPEGYTVLKDPIEIQLRIYCVYDGEKLEDVKDEDIWRVAVGEAGVLSPDWEVVQGPLVIKNYAGPRFPETGGIGRLIFIVGGISLMCSAVVGMVVTSVRRKKKLVID